MKITQYSFGRITINGRTYTSDIKIVQGKIVPNWWRDQGHLLQVQDIQDIIAARPHTLIIGTGASGVMRLAPDIHEYLGREGIKVEFMPTGQAVERFNELVQIMGEDQVAAAFHLTC